MRIKLVAPARVLMPAGTELDLVDSQAALYLQSGLAVELKNVRKATKEPAEKKTKK